MPVYVVRPAILFGPSDPSAFVKGICVESPAGTEIVSRDGREEMQRFPENGYREFPGDLLNVGNVLFLETSPSRTRSLLINICDKFSKQ